MFKIKVHFHEGMCRETISSKFSTSGLQRQANQEPAFKIPHACLRISSWILITCDVTRVHQSTSEMHWDCHFLKDREHFAPRVRDFDNA